MKKNFAVSMHLFLISVFLCLSPLTTAHAAVGTWSNGKSMNYARWAQTMVALPDGKVMVVSGCSNGYCSLFRPTYEIYDPQLETWSTHDLIIDGKYYGFGGLDAIVFANQKILIAGVDNAGTSLLYNPQTDTWTKTGSLHTPRYHAGYYPEDAFFAITRSGDNGALVTGGKSGNTVLRSAESFDSLTKTWSEVSDMTEARWHHSAVTLLDGRILVAGGWDQSNQPLLTVELYDPAQDQWTNTGDLHHPHGHDIAIVLEDGRVLLTGSEGAELYDPEQGSWTDAGFSTMSKPGVVMLPNGNVMFIGGAANNGAKSSSAFIYNPIEQTTSSVSSMSQGRYWPSAVLLSNDNSVLVAGGFGSAQELSSVEIYDTGIPVGWRVFVPIVAR
jgi:N-acetylneuraminic acid mutarotase